jgi:hypothetical protein
MREGATERSFSEREVLGRTLYASTINTAEF